jgi:hypothetical protein
MRQLVDVSRSETQRGDLSLGIGAEPSSNTLTSAQVKMTLQRIFSCQEIEQEGEKIVFVCCNLTTLSWWVCLKKT